MSQPPEVGSLIEALRRETPALLRWGGGVARTLRQFDIELEGKSSGSSNTDALTLADLTVQHDAVHVRQVEVQHRRVDRGAQALRVTVGECALAGFADSTGCAAGIDDPGF